MKKILTLFLCTILLAAFTAGCGSKEADTQKQSDTGTAELAQEKIDGDSEEEEKDSQGELHHVEIDIADYGTIALELDADTAPITVENFLKLAEEGFYDGLTFHRIISGFMIQGGDPEGNGTGGSEETIKGEFSQNGIENDISHVRGVISMARSNDPDSASSQFFIVHEDSTFLDGEYAAFGRVTDGMEVVDQICENVSVQDDNGTVVSEDQPVISSIKIID